MSHQLLFIAISSLSVLYTSNVYLASILVFAIVFFYIRHFRSHYFLLISLLCYSFSTNRMIIPPEMPYEYIGRITQIRNSYAIANIASQQIILYQVDGVNFDDIIEIKGEFNTIEGIHNEGEFHFPTWAKQKGIYYAMDVKSYSVMEEGTTFRHRLFKKLQSNPSAVNTWLKMMLFQIYDEEEISYMALSSGMHLQFLVKGITNLATFFLSLSTVSLLMIVLITVIGLSTVMSASIKRILCSRIIYVCFQKWSTRDRLGLEIIILMLLWPSMRFELAFILPCIYRFLYIFNVHKINRMVMTCLIMIPIQFYFYQSIDFIQLLTFPLLRIFYGICYGMSWLLLFLPFLSMLLPIMKSTQTMLFRFNALIPKWYYLPNIIWMLVWLLYGFRYFNTKEKKHISKMVLLLLYTQISGYLNPFFQIMTIDVGQGDCTLFILPFQQGAMLLDVAGNLNKNIPEDIILPILKKRGIHELDKIIITHDDFDHSGGLAQLTELINVKEIIDKKQSIIELGPLPMSVPLFDVKYETANDNSIILFFEIYGYKLMFMGDAGHENEKDITREYPKLKVDILKIGHHGSKHSSLPEFIHQLDPRIALISCGRKNRYGHPDKTVMEILENEEVYPLITSRQGSNTLYFSNLISFYKTADGEFGIIKHR